MSRLLARLRLVNSNLWKDPLKLSLSSPETKVSILSLLKTSSKKWQEGDDPEFKEIAKEEKPYVRQMFERCVNEEKAWAEYLFKDGSMIGLNDKLLHQYVRMELLTKE